MDTLSYGTIDTIEPGWLTNRYFPCKVGGLPAWLELEFLPDTKELNCTDCGNPKSFLCQIYCPLTDEHNFHRSVYIFVCRTPSCQKPNSASNFLVLRSQLPRENKFYSREPPNENDEVYLPAVPALKKLCFVCGCYGKYSCQRCKSITYCSSAHQRLDWSKHKSHCAPSQKDQAQRDHIPEVVFPELEILIEGEDDNDKNGKENSMHSDEETDDDDDDDKEQQRLQEYSNYISNQDWVDEEDIDVNTFEKTAAAVTDENFKCFKKEISKCPGQVVRYQRGGEPLWIADPKATIAEQLDVPKCEFCGAQRKFEFQIMPQMLTWLKDTNLDWGVLAVYTCTKSCKPKPGVGYLREFIVKQDLINGGK